MKKYVTADALGITDADQDEVIITFYGPRGGTRSIESLTAENATLLGHALVKAANEIMVEETVVSTAKPSQPDGQDTTNEALQKRGRATLSMYREATNDTDDDQTALVDILANLMHLGIVRDDLNFNDAIRIATGHVTAEINEQSDLKCPPPSMISMTARADLSFTKQPSNKK